MRRYELSIRSYVIEQRKKGIPWKNISQEVKAKFGVEPPTIRAMQKWVKRGLDRAQIDKMLIEEARKKLPEAAALTQAFFSEVMLPSVWRSQAIGADLEETMWEVFLGAMESAIGSVKFERFIDTYMKRRAEVKEQVEKEGFFSSTLQKIRQEKKEEEVKADEGKHQTKE